MRTHAVKLALLLTLVAAVASFTALRHATADEAHKNKKKTLRILPVQGSSSTQTPSPTPTPAPTQSASPQVVAAPKATPLKTSSILATPAVQLTSFATEEYVNPSELHFMRAPRAIVPIEEEGDEVIPAVQLAMQPKSIGTVKYGDPAFKRLGTSDRNTNWNSVEARRLNGQIIQIAPDAEAMLNDRQVTMKAIRNMVASTKDPVCIEPDIVKPGSDCCNYGIQDQVANKKYVYRQPAWALANGDNAASEADCREFAATVTASMPFFVPYRNKHVRAGQGWFYNSGSFHGAVDYSKDEYEEGKDPSFKIYSIGEGVVRSVVWDNWSGNIIVIEHTAPNGKKYRSAYKHMRNGFTNDLAMAKAIPVPADKKYDADGKPTQTYKYNLYANKPNPSQLQWGTDAQKIQVHVGQNVHAGTFLGWSGNTGPGGAGKGLKDDGTPSNPVTANNHLHFMMTVPNPNGDPTEWVQVDPYGVYSQTSSECYDVLDDTPYTRLFAPFYTAFHNVPIPVFVKRFGYFPNMGYGLQTVSVHRRNDKVLVSGAFQYGMPPAWYCRVYMTGTDYQHWFDEYGKQGFRPRELSVTNDAQGNPRFSAIWKKSVGEAVVAHHNMTDATWKAKWDEYVVKGGMRVEECVTYTDHGAARLAAVFVKDAEHGFYEKHYMDSNALQLSFNTYSGQGFALTNVSAAEINGKTLYTGVWRKRPGTWAARHGMSPSDYQRNFDEFAKNGFRLYEVHGYDNSERFAAVWTKP